MQKSTQDYLKTVYSLSKNGEIVSNTDIAQKLNVTPASVTEMLKKLADENYIKYSPYHGSTLTEKGLKEAQKITRKHRLLESFLSNVLHIGNDKVHQEACQMEHALSDEAEESLCRLLKHPDTCPDDGKTIPACDLPFSNCEECTQLHQKGLEQVGKRDKNLISIRELKNGSIGKISFIRGEHKVLQRLLDMGLTPGTKIQIIKVAPMNGPVEVAVRGTKLALGQDIACNVFVEMETTNK
ncbi:MAG: metal-dependent transcriptional regulator [Candidatus Bathyarchaeota archaeon]|nr:metal-dependent transcriptional regulator [Candidatus Termiticorpusculum sp.]MCL1970936.1 metal-dependent transcriptional regulator [Candidatus Termiticorpusculum sp.]